ncbi:MAG TPA: hypothetical protein VFX11_09430 [Candidatus Kapabacteria bacterium]|nr:hypothetical protein [Candidatus Kapabacteria bacterium]
MTQQELLARLRTYIGGALGNAAADEIERLTQQVAWWKQAASTSRDDAHAWQIAANAKFEQPTIERIAQQLAEHGLTIVSGKDAEKIKRCECDTIKKCIDIVERYKVPVGNSSAGELACEWTMDALREIRDEMKGLCDG